MADSASSRFLGWKNKRDSGKGKFKDRKKQKANKKFFNGLSKKSPKKFERESEEMNASHSSGHWEEGRVGYKTNYSPSKRDKYNRDSSKHGDVIFVEEQRLTHNGGHFSDRTIDESRYATSYDNHVDNDDDEIVFLKKKVEQLKGQVEYFYQENEKLKYGFSIKNSYAHSSTNLDVNISFRDKSLERKFLPVLQDLMSEIIAENIGVEDLETFLFSQRNSATNPPEGELFSLDNSTSEQSEYSHIPCYDSSFQEILQDPDVMTEIDAQKDKPGKRSKSCFNCSEDHKIQECPYKMDFKRIAIAKKERSSNFVPQVRYHVQGKQEKDLKPGVISDKLREALRLSSDEVPPFIFHMRVLDYPPGWLEEAEVEASGIALYGTDVDKTSEADRQMFQSKVQYDPAKLIDFPGFNVPLPPNFTDDAEYLGWPPLQDWQLRSVFEQSMPKVEPPKRKRKLSSPEQPASKVLRFEEDMEVVEEIEVLEEDDCLEFTPPLPDENLPPPPPEDEPSPPPPPENDIQPPPPLPDDDSIPLPPEEDSIPSPPIDSQPDEEIVFVESDESQSALTTEEPSLKDLEELKKRLELALDEACSSNDSIPIVNQDSPVDSLSVSRQNSMTESGIDSCELVPLSQVSITESQEEEENDQKRGKLPRTDSQGSKLVSLGTPSLSRHSSFHKLPSYDNFAKDVTDHLNFENLPNSVGTYQKMKKVIKKVKEKINSFMQ